MPASTDHPVFKDGQAVEKSAARVYLGIKFPNANALRALDMSQTGIVWVGIEQFYRDADDTTSADDGVTVIVDDAGNRWKVISGSGGIQIDVAGLFADRDDYDDEEQPFAYYATDQELLYVRNSEVSGVWSSGFSIKGDDGEPGETPEFTIGTVGQEPSGGTPDATITGTPTDPVLNLVLVDGADGTDPGILLTAQTSTSDSDPGGPGGIRANNVSLAAAAFLYVDKANRAGSNIETFLLSLDDSTNGTVKGNLVLTRTTDEEQAAFEVTGVTDATGYVKIAVQGHSGETDLLQTVAPISFQFARAGNKGNDGLGAGDFVGPGSAVSGNLVSFGDTTGKLGADSGVAASAVVTASSTTTFTNKTFNANGTGNSLSNVETADVASGSKSGADATLITGTAGSNGTLGQWNSDGDIVAGPLASLVTNALQKGIFDIPLDAGYFTAKATNGAEAVAYDSGANDATLLGFAFDTSTQEYIQCKIPMPKGWDLLTFTAIPYWTNASGSSTQNVVWSVAATVIRNDDTLNVTLGTGQTSNDTWLAQNDLHVGPETSPITPAGTAAAQCFLLIEVSRVVGSDNMTGDAVFLGLLLRPNFTAANDA
jgi:hypothetical protein